MTPKRIGRHISGGPGREGADAELQGQMREAFSRWAAGVAIVAVRGGDRVNALTASAIIPVSLDPPLVLVSLGGNAAVLPFLDDGAEFGISFLTAAQRGLAGRYADSFPVGPTPFPDSGVPLVTGALEALTCRAEEVLERGDHHLVIGRVLAVDHGAPGARPLVYFERRYGTVRSDWPADGGDAADPGDAGTR